MASSSLHPPAIVHVASNLSESNHQHAAARCRTPSLHPDEDHYDDDEDILDEGVSVVWTDSPLSSCPNSPPTSPHHYEDDDDNDNEDPGAVPFSLLDLSSARAVGATAYGLSRQDSQLGARESRLERLKLEHQSRFAGAALEEKKTADAGDVAHRDTRVGEDEEEANNNSNHYYHHHLTSSTTSCNDVSMAVPEEPPADPGLLPNISERSRVTLRMRQNLSSAQQHPSNNMSAISMEDNNKWGVEVLPCPTRVLSTFSAAEEDPGEIPLTLETSRNPGVIPLLSLDEGDGNIPVVVALSPNEEVAYSIPLLPEEEAVEILQSARDEEEADMMHRNDDYSVPMDESVGESVPMDEDRVSAPPSSTDNNDPNHLTLHPRIIEEFDRGILLDTMFVENTAEPPKVSLLAAVTSTSLERNDGAISVQRKQLTGGSFAVDKRTPASAVYSRSNQHLQIVGLVDHDVPLDELQEDYHEELSRQPPSPSSSSSHLSSASVKSIPMDEVDEFFTPAPQRRHEQILDRRDPAQDLQYQAMRRQAETQCDEDHEQQRDHSDIAVHQHREYGKRAEPLQQGDTKQQPRQYLLFDSDRWSIPIVTMAPTDELGAHAVSFERQEPEMESFAQVPSFDEFDDDLVPVNWNPLEESCLELIENDERNTTLSPLTTSTRGREATAVSPSVRIASVFTSCRHQQQQHWHNDQHRSRHSPTQTGPDPRNNRHPYATLPTTSSSADAINTEKCGVPNDESVEVIPENDTVEVIHCDPDDFEEQDSSSAPEDELDTTRQSLGPASPKKSPVSKKGKAAQTRDVTGATMPEEDNEISLDGASNGYTIHQRRQQNALESDDQPSDDNVGPLPDIEMHRPLFPHDDVSSSDETPIMSNSPSGLTRSRRAGGHHNDWNGLNQDYYSKHPRGQRRKRMRKKILKRRASASKNSKKRPVEEQSALPALVVDHDQLRAIGVKTLMSVCNGIGSLFLTAAASSSDTKQLLPSPKAPYQKLSPEQPSRNRLTPISRQQYPKSPSKSLSPSRGRLHREAASVDSCPIAEATIAEVTGAAVFREAFDQSVRAEQDSHSVQMRPVRSNKRKTVAVKKSERESGRLQSTPPDQRQSGKTEQQQRNDQVNPKHQQGSTHPPQSYEIHQPQRQHIGTELDEADRMLSQRISLLSCVSGSRSVQRNDSVSADSKSLQAPGPMKNTEASLADQFSNPSQEHAKLKNGQNTHSKDGKNKRPVTRHNFSEGWSIETKVGSRRKLASNQSVQPQELESPAEKEKLHPETGKTTEKQKSSDTVAEQRKHSPESEAAGSTSLEKADKTTSSLRSDVHQLSMTEFHTRNDENTTTRSPWVECREEESARLETSLPGKYDATIEAEEEISTSSPVPEPSSSAKWLQVVLEIALRSRRKDISERSRKFSVKPSPVHTDTSKAFPPEAPSPAEIILISEPPVVRRVNVSLNLEEFIGAADDTCWNHREIASPSKDNQTSAYLKSMVVTSEDCSLVESKGETAHNWIDRVGALRPSTGRRAASESGVENVDSESIMCHFQPAEPAESAAASLIGTPSVSSSDKMPHYAEATTNIRSDNGDCDESVHVDETSLKTAAASPEASLCEISANAAAHTEDDKRFGGCFAPDSCDMSAIQESRVLEGVINRDTEIRAVASETPVIACRTLSILDYVTEGVVEQIGNAEGPTKSGRSHEYAFDSTPTCQSSATLQELAGEVDDNDTEKRHGNGLCCSEDSDSESDESTDKLMSQLDDMIKDLDGLVGSRRIERSFTEESFATTFSSPTVAENSKADLKALISSESPEYVSGAMPALIKSLNNEIGIPKGDIVISLLNNKLSEPGSWSNRVDEAIWRCRTMRRNLSTKWQEKKASRKSRTNLLSVRIDVDDVRVVGGIDKIVGTQETAFDYLEYDDLDDALTLCESINLSCETFVEEMQPDQGEKCKACVASTFHNLGIIYMLRGEFDDALPCFEQATFLLAECHGPGHIDHVASLVKLAMCRFAIEDYTEAFSDLHDALSLSRKITKSLSDYRQLAEILNNLGCLSYMGGELEKAMVFLREANKIQTIASDNSLYIGSKFSSQSVALNTSVTNGNIGFISLLLQEVTESVTILETAMREQQLLLRDAHVTLVRTMEHLAVANLFAGRKRHALQLLRRLYHLQMDAFGRLDSRTRSTRSKIAMLEVEGQEVQEPVTEIDPAIQGIPLIDESKDDGKLNSSIFKALRHRQQKSKEEKSQMPH